MSGLGADGFFPELEADFGIGGRKGTQIGVDEKVLLAGETLKRSVPEAFLLKLCISKRMVSSVRQIWRALPRKASPASVRVSWRLPRAVWISLAP